MSTLQPPIVAPLYAAAYEFENASGTATLYVAFGEPTSEELLHFVKYINDNVMPKYLSREGKKSLPSAAILLNKTYVLFALSNVRITRITYF